MTPACARPGLLASVATLEEMDLARAGGVHIIDLKDPSRGALGAWPPAQLAAAVAQWRGYGKGRPVLSATIGDHPPEPAILRAAAEAVAATGVPLVKVGLFRAAGKPAGDEAPQDAADGCLRALAPLAARHRLVAVLFADRERDPAALLPAIAAAGFAGAMLDTAAKDGRRLTDHLPPPVLDGFIARARALGLMTGLAGSLRLADVAPLGALGPDYLGFRGALCEGGRQAALSPSALAAVQAALAAVRTAGTPWRENQPENALE